MSGRAPLSRPSPPTQHIIKRNCCLGMCSKRTIDKFIRQKLSVQPLCEVRLSLWLAQIYCRKLP